MRSGIFKLSFAMGVFAVSGESFRFRNLEAITEKYMKVWVKV
jgi:hypothetical protein